MGWIIVVGIVGGLLGLLWLTRPKAGSRGGRDVPGPSAAEREALGREAGNRIANGPNQVS